VSAIAFVEYGASVASDFEDGDQCFGELKLILVLQSYAGSTSLKTSYPCGFHPCEKECGSQ
jgi:hypothetical protein